MGRGAITVLSAMLNSPYARLTFGIAPAMSFRVAPNKFLAQRQPVASSRVPAIGKGSACSSPTRYAGDTGALADRLQWPSVSQGKYEKPARVETARVQGGHSSFARG